VEPERSKIITYRTTSEGDTVGKHLGLTFYW